MIGFLAAVAAILLCVLYFQLRVETFCDLKNINVKDRNLYSWLPLFATDASRNGCYYQMGPGEQSCASNGDEVPVPTLQPNKTQQPGMQTLNCVYRKDAAQENPVNDDGQEKPENQQVLAAAAVAPDDFSAVRKPEGCNVASCNARMKNWIIDHYWRFEDTANYFAECKACPTRSFTAPMNVKIDGQWKKYNSKEEAYAAAELKDVS
jgi:hypothetical protein